MNSQNIKGLALFLALFILMGISIVHAQCTATIVDGNGSFNDNQIGWSSSSGNTTVQAAPAPEATSSDGGGYLKPAITGSTESVNIAMGELNNGDIYRVDWEAIHGLSGSVSSYPDSAIYVVKILDGNTPILSQDFRIDDPNAWVPQSLTFTSSSTNLFFQISLLASNFNSGIYKMGIDGMTITCNGTTKPCDLVAPNFTKKI